MKKKLSLLSEEARRRFREKSFRFQSNTLQMSRARIGSVASWLNVMTLLGRSVQEVLLYGYGWIKHCYSTESLAERAVAHPPRSAAVVHGAEFRRSLHGHCGYCSFGQFRKFAISRSVSPATKGNLRGQPRTSTGRARCALQRRARRVRDTVGHGKLMENFQKFATRHRQSLS